MKVSKEKGILHLDLHGISHIDAEIEVQDFCLRYQDQLPLNIICGNSAQMIKIAKNALQILNIEFDEPRYGIVRVMKL
jgi:hypothetical protein